MRELVEEVLAGPGGDGVMEILARLREAGVPVRTVIGEGLWVAGRKVVEEEKPLHEVLVRMFGPSKGSEAD